MCSRAWSSSLIFAWIGLALFTCSARASDSQSIDPPWFQETSDKITQISSVFEMRSAWVDESFEQAQTVGLGVSIGIEHKLADSLTARIAVGLNLDTGSSQTTFTDEYKPIQGVLLLDAYLDWKPIDDGHLRGGAINQSWLESPLLMGNLAFPAVMGDWKQSFDQVYVRLLAEQAIPTSDTTHSIPQGNEPLPSANFERVVVGATPGLWQFQAHAGHYAFSNLPSGVANESRIRGNSVTGVGDQGSQFIYDFDGFESGARIENKISDDLKVQIDGTYLTNLRVPLQQSRGMMLVLEVTYKIQDNLFLTPKAEWFRSESDSAPAYYNTSNLAHNNREGVGAGASLSFPKDRLDVEGEFVHANVIQVNPFQSNFTGVVFSLRKSYDFL
jgi:hypothetical protein